MEKPQKEIFIIKASGEKEIFSDSKLRHSLERAGAGPIVTEKIVSHVKNKLKDGMKTSDIYRYAFSLLQKQESSTASRYSLKQTVMELGPSGYPFEKLVGELLRTQGFFVEVGKTIQGACVSHEVDVVAKKDERHIMVECKFHNQPGIKSDVKVALYVQARFEDIRKQWEKQPNHSQKFHEVWLVTNTKLTSDAIQYASCVEMKAIAWNHPLNGSLQDLIEKSGLHPLTCLAALSNNDKRILLDNGLVFCKEIIENKQLLRNVGLNELKISKIEKEINALRRALLDQNTGGEYNKNINHKI